MARQSFTPQPHRDRNPLTPEDDMQGWSSSSSPQFNPVSEKAQQSLDDIDAVLGDYDRTSSQLKQSENAAGQAAVESTKNPGDTPRPVKQDEENPLGYQPSGAGSSAGKSRFKGYLKKFGPTGGILGLILGGVFGLGVMFSPSLAIIQLKEVLMGDLNDSSGAMETRTTHVWRAKLKDTVGKNFSACNGIVKFRCGLRGMSDRQIRAFERAGIEVEKGDRIAGIGKRAVKSLTFTDSAGNKIKIDSVDKLRQLSVDRSVASQLRRAYNPKFYTLWDGTAGRALKKLGVTKADKLKGSTAEDLDKSMQETLDGKKSGVAAEAKAGQSEDKEGKKAVADAEKMTERIKGGSGIGSVFKNSAKGISVLGIADSACSVLNASLMVEGGAKVIRAAQLATYASVFLTLADMMKASSNEATPEKVSYAGEKLTATDSNEKTINETSPIVDDKPQEVANPYYGKNAFDSEGYRAAAYNDAPKLTARAQQFAIGGALIGTLASVNQKVIDVVGNGSRKQTRKNCGLVQNNFVRGAGLIVGVIAAIGSFGVTTVASIGGSVAFALALPILEGYLSDMVAGKVVSAATSGVDSGNAIFAGSAAILGTIAMSRGLQPANKSMLRSYKLATKDIENQYIADEVEAAKKTPFDVMNQYSFAGSLTRKLMPVTMAANAQVGSATRFISSFGSTLSSALLPSVYAADDFNEERYSQCEDYGYAELGIDADIMCNVRYVMTPTELAMDTDQTYQWMYDKGFVNEDGEVKDPDNKYQKWIDECRDRQVGWGSTTEDESDDDGSACLDPDASRTASTSDVQLAAANLSNGTFTLSELQHFRVFTTDRGIEQGMDDGPTSGEVSTGEVTVGGEVDGSIADLAKIILENSGTGKTFNIKGGYSDSGANRRLSLDLQSRSTITQQLEDMAAGKLPHSSTYACSGSSGSFYPPTTVTPDPTFMKFLADVGQNSGLKNVQVNALFNLCHSQTSQHYKGKAIDFGCVDAASSGSNIIRTMDSIAKKYGVKRNWENCANNAHWHYSVGGM